MAFSKLYGLECEIKINRKITKTGSVGRREPENLFGVALVIFCTVTGLKKEPNWLVWENSFDVLLDSEANSLTKNPINDTSQPLVGSE